MKVLHVYKTYYPDSFGGVENAMLQIAEGSRKYGVDCKVLTLSKNPSPQKIKIKNHEVVRANSNIEIASTGISLEFFRLFSEMSAQADLVHYHFPWPMMDIAHLLQKDRKPSLVSYQLDITKQKTLLHLYKPLQHIFLSSVDRIVASSPNYLNTSKVLANYRDKVEIIPIGIDRENYPTPSVAKIAEWKAKLPEKFFLFVGVFRYYKGLHILLEAAKNLSCPIVLVGSGPEECNLKHFAEVNNLTNVFFMGSLPEEDKVALLQLCSGLIFPSHLRSESFGITLLEAAMFGKPLISCEIGTGTTYVNIREQTGLVAQPADAESLAHAINRLWTNSEEAERFGRNALTRFNELFVGQKMVSSFVSLYEQLASKTKPVIESVDVPVGG